MEENPGGVAGGVVSQHLHVHGHVLWSCDSRPPISSYGGDLGGAVQQDVLVSQLFLEAEEDVGSGWLK